MPEFKVPKNTGRNIFGWLPFVKTSKEKTLEAFLSQEFDEPEEGVGVQPVTYMRGLQIWLQQPPAKGEPKLSESQKADILIQALTQMPKLWGKPSQMYLPFFPQIFGEYQTWQKGQPEDTGLTAYQTAQLQQSEEARLLGWAQFNALQQEREMGWKWKEATAQREYEIEKGKQEQTAAWAKQQQYAARASAQMGMEDIRPLLAEAFEAGRTARVSGLTGYGDWIKRWDALHQVNPYTVPQSELVQQRISQLEGQPGKEAELAQAREDAYGIAWAEQERFLREGARPATPPAPGWLSEFVPGLKAGQPISRQNIPIPSGQQLTRLPWSQAQGLAGYAEWAGGNWEDIVQQSRMMQPFTPNVASRWQPARQRRG